MRTSETIRRVLAHLGHITPIFSDWWQKLTTTDLSLPTPKSLCLNSQDFVDYFESSMVSGEALLDQTAQKQLKIKNDCDKILKKISRALKDWSPSKKYSGVQSARSATYVQS